MDVVFYDQNGQPVAYAEHGIHMYLFSGKPIAYIDSGSVYSFSGRHLGWYQDGWIRDNNGDAVLFTPGARGGPAKPGLAGLPGRAGKQGLPGKAGREARPGRPGFSGSWSGVSPKIFFKS